MNESPDKKHWGWIWISALTTGLAVVGVCIVLWIYVLDPGVNACLEGYLPMEGQNIFGQVFLALLYIILAAVLFIPLCFMEELIKKILSIPILIILSLLPPPILVLWRVRKEKLAHILLAYLFSWIVVMGASIILFLILYLSRL